MMLIITIIKDYCIHNYFYKIHHMLIHAAVSNINIKPKEAHFYPLPSSQLSFFKYTFCIYTEQIVLMIETIATALVPYWYLPSYTHSSCTVTSTVINSLVVFFNSLCPFLLKPLRAQVGFWALRPLLLSDPLLFFSWKSPADQSLTYRQRLNYYSHYYLRESQL